MTNTSCLIGLELIGRLDLLQGLFREVVTAPEVIEEFGSSPSWLVVRAPVDRECVGRLSLALGLGESAAICLARELGDCVLVLDDLRARRAASVTGLEFVGRLALVASAKEHGLIELAAPLVRQMESKGFRVDERVANRALARVGEQF